MNNQLPNGLTLIQQNPDCAVALNGGRGHGWLYVKGPDGQWITHRKLDDWEIMQAEDQRDAGIIQHGTKVRAG